MLDTDVRKGEGRVSHIWIKADRGRGRKTGIFCNCRLTSDLYNLSIVSSSLVTIVLHTVPKVELAFLDASAHCSAYLLIMYPVRFSW